MTRRANLVLAYALGALSTASVASAGYLPPLDAAARLLTDAGQATYEIERATRQVRDPQLRQTLRHHTRTLSVSIDGLQRIVADSAVAPIPQHVPQAITMDDATLRRVLAAMEDATFGKEQRAIALSATRDRWLTVHQVRALMTPFAFDSDQVELAAALYPNVIDPENWFEVYGVLTFSSDVQALRRRTEG